MPGSGVRAADLTVVIPTRDRWEILGRTLTALSVQTAPGFETLVVVDGSDQRPPEPLTPDSLALARLLVRDHAGPGAARNTGVAATERPLLLFLGDDMVPAPDLVARHLAAHDRHPEPTSAVLGSVSWHPSLRRDRLAGWFDWSGAQFDFGSIQGEEAGFGHFYSCNVSLGRELFVDAGGFDEDFTYYYEDLDLGRRLSERGMRLWYEPAARAHHLHAYDWDAVERRFAGVARGERLMAAKHGWFVPFFAERARAALTDRRPRLGAVWARLAPAVGDRRVRDRADRWYWARLAPRFLDAWEAETDLAELREYLGPAYDHARLVDHQGEVEREAEAIGDEAALYRTSEAYLYDLTAFAMSGTKVPYLADLRRLVPPGARLLDWGCGIGSDGLRLLGDGYQVSFADFDNPSTRYLRWRLERRGLSASAPVYDLDGDDIPHGYDAAYAFDVVEHAEDPFGFLDELERRASLVMVNLLEPSPDDPPLHRDLPIPALLDHATRSGLVHYRRYHAGRSHLVAYRPRASGSRVLRRGRARAQRLLATLR